MSSPAEDLHMAWQAQRRWIPHPKLASKEPHHDSVPYHHAKHILQSCRQRVQAFHHISSPNESANKRKKSKMTPPQLPAQSAPRAPKKARSVDE